jgi:hypothetical protein
MIIYIGIYTNIKEIIMQKIAEKMLLELPLKSFISIIYTEIRQLNNNSMYPSIKNNNIID